MNGPAEPMIDPAALQSHRSALVRFAMLQLRDEALVEDLVQETYLAALASGGQYSGKSSVRTWLTGILRHKIVDHFRSSGRQVSLDAVVGEAGGDEIDAMFRANGHYVETPQDWGDPADLLSQRRFMEALEHCVSGLPVVTSQAFLMRELMGCDTGEICKELGITSTNCFVLLHRARMRLRACLELSWLGGKNRR